MNEQPSTQQEELKRLFDKYLANTCTREEFDRLYDLVQQEGQEAYFLQLMTAAWNITDPLPARLLEELPALSPPGVRRMKRPLWKWAAAAAVLVLATVAGVYYFSGAPAHKAGMAVSGTERSIVPGGHHAVLTLADGSEITLDSAGNGTLARQGGMRVVKLGSGQLAYHSANGATMPAASLYHTLSTPLGGTYVVELPDGTRAWLNAASSLRYPAAFSGQERRVELTGEAYFEVARRAGQPFRVAVKLSPSAGTRMIVEVLGTRFNVNAYADEPAVRTTLLEGAVSAQAGSKRVTIQPGQQASLPAQGNDFAVAQADLSQAIAWKEGYFRFRADNITTIMQQLARWYDIEPVYEGNMSGKNFSGTISRHAGIAEVLQILESTEDIKFRIKGRQVIVSALPYQ